jgi:hypothetical protein
LQDAQPSAIVGGLRDTLVETYSWACICCTIANMTRLLALCHRPLRLPLNMIRRAVDLPSSESWRKRVADGFSSHGVCTGCGLARFCLNWVTQARRA